MMDPEDQIGFLIVVIVLVTLVLGIRKYLEYKKKLLTIALRERHESGKYLYLL